MRRLVPILFVSLALAQGPAPQPRRVEGLAEADRLSKAFPETPSHMLAAGEFGSVFLATPSKPIRMHYHAAHDEAVVILRGEGMMRLGEKEIKVKPNDIVFVPKGTIHDFRPSGEGAIAVSCFAPVFDGKDRVFVDPPNGGQ